jgi:hypothetical protein
MSNTSESAMPKWVPKAIVVFWLGFLGAHGLKSEFAGAVRAVA